MKQFFQNDRLASHLGIELLETSGGSAKMKMQVEPEHLNSVDVVHGGAIFTLADTAFAVASNSREALAVAINAHITYMKAATTGTLYAEAKETSLHHKLATYTINVTNEGGDLIATFQGMVYRKTPKESRKDQI